MLIVKISASLIINYVKDIRLDEKIRFSTVFGGIFVFEKTEHSLKTNDHENN